MSTSTDRELDYPPPWNFSWVVMHELAGMAWPKSTDNLRFLERQGVKHLVTLSPEKKPPVHAFPNIKWTVIEIEEFCSPSLNQMKTFIEVCENCKRQNEAVGVHCRMGIGRTGVMAACYLVHFYNKTPEQAINLVRIMRPCSIETYEQEEAVTEYHEHLQKI